MLASIHQFQELLEKTQYCLSIAILVIYLKKVKFRNKFFHRVFATVLLILYTCNELSENEIKKTVLL